ncbi:hypothetical protein ACFFBA_001051 [Sneathia vaginalis]|uniref:Uncharacterized protein n=1 Tax=Sneathia vaginalis TaxID=187101 RepID=A0A0E3Z9B0_9FUSO|nr:MULTISPECIES: hypothetical protein [Sneathia]AKC95066.1 hypothetical protein VC03_00460 [Sneathia vaginalis]MBE2990357.1 hypothetical protein [Sneathia sp. DSM 16630]MBE3031474.1 hypothetical protein [Sneathia sp. DSM 16631]MDK9581556.1 hypothetical protein [Sneathia vaginalis]
MSIVIGYRKPYSNIIVAIMKKYSLYTETELIKNIELIIPVSKVLKGKKISYITYSENTDGIFFNLG